jgi:hypothetical protein
MQVKPFTLVARKWYFYFCQRCDDRKGTYSAKVARLTSLVTAVLLIRQLNPLSVECTAVSHLTSKHFYPLYFFDQIERHFVQFLCNGSSVCCESSAWLCCEGALNVICINLQTIISNWIFSPSANFYSLPQPFSCALKSFNSHIFTLNFTFSSLFLASIKSSVLSLYYLSCKYTLLSTYKTLVCNFKMNIKLKNSLIFIYRK